ncbi:MAG: hypothetical protein OQJ76_08470 [Rhodospirillales bacterium]|nr:hypothetical protein [Rhodospirillales bacterium]
MSLLGMFKRSKGAPAEQSPFHGPIDPNWERGPDGRYRKLALIDTDSAALKVGGVYVIWHGGVRPEWVWVGVSSDVGEALERCLRDKEISEYSVHGGLYATWSTVLEPYRNGVAKYLVETMEPRVENPNLDLSDAVSSIEVLFPGAKKSDPDAV